MNTGFVQNVNVEGLESAEEKIEFLKSGLNPEDGELTLYFTALQGLKKILDEISDQVRSGREAIEEFSRECRKIENANPQPKTAEDHQESYIETRRKLIGFVSEELYKTNATPEFIGETVFGFLTQHIGGNKHENARASFTSGSQDNDATAEPRE